MKGSCQPSPQQQEEDLVSSSGHQIFSRVASIKIIAALDTPLHISEDKKNLEDFDEVVITCNYFLFWG